MRSFIIATIISLTVSMSMGIVQSAEAACLSNYHALGSAQVNSYNPDGSSNITVYMYDWDSQNTGGIARYNTSGQVLQVTSVPYMNFVLPKGAHQYVVFKDVCTNGSFAGHWDRGFAW